MGHASFGDCYLEVNMATHLTTEVGIPQYTKNLSSFLRKIHSYQALILSEQSQITVLI